MPQLDVYATDLITETLNVARRNASKHDVALTFLEGDLLTPFMQQQITLEGLISNPPYIDVADKAFMEKTVLDYEPHHALFAASEGYALYARMIQQLPYVMCDGAPVVFEIGHNQGETLKEMVTSCHPQCHVDVLRDINGHARIVSFIWREK